MQRPGPWVTEWVIPAAFYVALTLIAIPHACSFTSTNLAPFEGSDAVYRMVWFYRCAMTEGLSCWYLTDLFAPPGLPVTQMSAGIGKEALAALTLWFLPAWVANNLLILSTPTTVGLVAHAFSRRVIGASRTASVVAGWLAAWTGFAALRNSAPWLISTEGLILFLWALVLLGERPTLRNALLAGLAAGLSGWLFTQFLVHVAVIASAWALACILARKERAVLWLPVVALAAAIIDSPLLYHMSLDRNSTFWVSEEDLVAGSSPLSAFIAPPPSSGLLGWFGVLVRGTPEPVRGSYASYLGLVPLACTLAGLGKPHRARAVLIASAAIAAILSVGPVVTWTGSEPLCHGPYAVLQDIPGFRYGMRVLCRFNTTTQLALGLLAAPGIDVALRLASRAARPVFGLFLAILHLFDQRAYNDKWLEFAATIPPCSPVFSTMATEPGNFAVLDIPYLPGTTQFMYNGAFHRKRVIWGFGSRMSHAHRMAIEESFRFPGILACHPGDPEGDLSTFAQALVDHGVRYIIVNTTMYRDLAWLQYRTIRRLEDAEAWQGQSIVGAPELIFEDDLVRVYKVEPCL